VGLTATKTTSQADMTSSEELVVDAPSCCNASWRLWSGSAASTRSGGSTPLVINPRAIASAIAPAPTKPTRCLPTLLEAIAIADFFSVFRPFAGFLPLPRARLRSALDRVLLRMTTAYELALRDEGSHPVRTYYVALHTGAVYSCIAFNGLGFNFL
jgi:hypothetical protein